MLPDRVSNPGPLTYESGALPIALHGPAQSYVCFLVFFGLRILDSVLGMLLRKHEMGIWGQNLEMAKLDKIFRMHGRHPTIKLNLFKSISPNETIAYF